MSLPRPVFAYNSLTGKKSQILPIVPGHIKLYACGVTVYDDCHIGHAMQAIFFDVIRRYLESLGYQVTYVRNFTDVDDKIIARAETLSMTPLALSEAMIQASNRDMKSIGVRPATYEPKVSESIPEIIAMIESLIQRGMAYATSRGDVYYRVRKKSDYGKLSNRNPDDLLSGTRDLVEGDKEDPLDFALWKSDTTPTASWQSPWGQGRPGWHIECSAMAKKYLGENFDLHGGGRDLIFPHHENEIAQSESANQTPYANCWMHSGLLTIDKQKMSKSLGNSIRIQDFVKSWNPEVLRLAFLQNHYRSNIDFSEDSFAACQKRLLYFYETLLNLDGFLGKEDLPLDTDLLKEHTDTFHGFMSDDFNTAGALGELSKLARRGNHILKTPKAPQAKALGAAVASLLRKFGEILGLLALDPAEFVHTTRLKLLPTTGVSLSELLERVEARKLARLNKDFATGDVIRADLLSKGIILKDLPSGETEWSLLSE